MKWNSLSETLVGLAGAVIPAPDVDLVVTEAEMRIPLEVRMASRFGRLQVYAQPGHTRWKSGFLPPTHVAHIRLTLETGDGE